MHEGGDWHSLVPTKSYGPLFIFSSPEHEVLMVSYCDRPSSGVRRACVRACVRASVRVSSTIDFKRLLLRNRLLKLDEIWQECSLGQCLPNLLKELKSVQK